MEPRLSELEVERIGKEGKEKRIAAALGAIPERDRQTILDHGCQ